MASFCGPHKLQIACERELKFAYTGNASPTTALSIGYLEYGTNVTVSINQPTDNYSVSLPLQGRQLVRESETRTFSEVDRALVVSPDRCFTIDIDGSYRSLFVTINRKFVELALRNLIGRPVTQPLVFEPEMQLGGAGAASWWRTAKYYLRELGTEGSIFSYPNMAAELELGLVRALLLAQRNNYSDEITRKFVGRLPEYFVRAKRYIEENFANAVKIEDIECASGVTSAKLCASFNEFSGTTPMAYLKKVRLDNVRLELLNGRLDRSISSLAMEAGLNHLGRFSVEYKQAFAESPTETRAKRRGSHSEGGLPPTAD